MKVAAVLLAAGKSSRMGSNKLLLELDGKTILEHLMLKLEKYPTTVVTGYKPEEIRPIIERFGAREAYNEMYERGMSASFRAGLLSLEPGVDAAFMVLSDTFGFREELLENMIATMEEDEDVFLVSPVHQGKRGHPVLVRRRLFADFIGITSGETMKDIVNRYEDKHAYVEGSIWCRIDLDTPEDYERVKKLWRGNCA